MIQLLYTFKFDNNTIVDSIERLNFSIESLINQKVKIIVFNSSNKCIKNNLVRINEIEYYHKYCDGVFNKSKLINYGVKNFISNNEYFLISDIDLIYQKNFIEKIEKYINNEKKPIRVVFSNYNIYEKIKNSDFDTLFKCRKSGGGYAHGNGLIHRDSFFKIRGYDEFYQEYGPEDDDFNIRIGVINKLIYDNNIISCHLWHKMSSRMFEEQNKNYFFKKKEDLKELKLKIESGNDLNCFEIEKIKEKMMELAVVNNDKWGEI